MALTRAGLSGRGVQGTARPRFIPVLADVGARPGNGLDLGVNELSDWLGWVVKARSAVIAPMGPVYGFVHSVATVGLLKDFYPVFRIFLNSF